MAIARATKIGIAIDRAATAAFPNFTDADRRENFAAALQQLVEAIEEQD